MCQSSLRHRLNVNFNNHHLIKYMRQNWPLISVWGKLSRIFHRVLWWVMIFQQSIIDWGYLREEWKWTWPLLASTSSEIPVPGSVFISWGLMFIFHIFWPKDCAKLRKKKLLISSSEKGFLSMSPKSEVTGFFSHLHTPIQCNITGKDMRGDRKRKPFQTFILLTSWFSNWLKNSTDIQVTVRLRSLSVPEWWSDWHTFQRSPWCVIPDVGWAEGSYRRETLGERSWAGADRSPGLLSRCSVWVCGDRLWSPTSEEWTNLI